MKKTFLILLVLLCVATMTVASVSAAADDMASDDLGTIDLDDNAIEPVSSTESDFSTSDNLAIDESVQSISDDSGTNDKSLEAAPLEDGETTVYVSTTGDDSNDGLSEANSVATVGKAVEIVNSSTGTDFKIFVKNGNYDIQKIESPEAKNVNLVGESKEGTILHASGTYGINVYEDNIKWNIENLTICDFNSSVSTSSAVRCFGADTDFSITNCIFRNIGSKNGAIYITSSGRRYISNVLIENCFGTYSSTSSIIHLYGEGPVTLDNIEVRGSYQDPSVGAATYLRSILYADDQQTNVTLKNSRIIDNIGAIGSLIEAKGIFNVINTTIANNYINYSANGVNGGTYMFYSGTSSNSASNINITQSVIKDNILAGGSMGLFNCVYGNHNIDHNIIMNNKYANGNDVPLGSFTGGSSISTDDNYWGTNERPNTKTTKWVILTVDVPEMAFVGVAESIPVCLNTYLTSQGETGSITGMPTVDLGVSYALNQANPSAVTIENGQGALNYLATLDGDETITLSTGDAFPFEVNADVSSLIYVDGSAETSGTGTADSPFKTIAEALNIAADGKIIVVRAGTYKEKDLNIQYDITIKADKNAAVIIDAENGGRIFTIMSTSTLRDLTLINGNIGTYGAGIFDMGNLTLNNVKIYNCTAEDGGAAVYVYEDANLTVVSSEFIDNKALEGGAIYVDEDATANITGSKFITNDPTNGGAIYVKGSADIESNEFTSNNATNGGAIYIDSTDAQTIKDNTFTSNTADKGEAIYIKNAPVTLSGNTIGEGQNIYLDGASLNTILTFIGGTTVNADFGETVTLTATLTDADGNPVRGGTVTFTANGETITTIDLSGDNELTTTYTVPSDATGDITISGSYSLDNGGTVVSGTIHPAVSYWFIEGGSGYETLAQAISAASAGDVIYYDLPDDYTEVINSKTINKALTIKNNGTATVTLDGGKSQFFTVSSNLELNNLNFINGGTSQGGFISQTGGTLKIVDSSFKDATSSSNGAVIYTSSGLLSIDGCLFENLTGKEGAIYYYNGYGLLNITNSVFNNITGTYDGWVISTKGPAEISNTNFTNLVSTQATSSNYYGAVYATKAMNVTGCYFANITGPKGAAIYSMGTLNVTKSVFDSITTTFSVIFASGSPSDISYNIFVNNGNVKAVDSSIADCDYNFWGSNEKPSTSVIAANRYTYWTIVELSSAADTVYLGTTADIIAQFVGTDGTENLTLEGEMPEYAFELTASSGTIAPTTVTIVNNEASAEFTPASEGTVTITATPGPSELVLNVMDTSSLLVVSTDGNDETGLGTLDSPYATIAHALSQVTDTRNIIYIKSTGEDYTESGLTVSGNVIIRGEDNSVTIDAENAGRIFIVTGNATIEDLNLTGAMTNDIGGAIYVNGGNLTVNNVIFESNGAGYGGAIGTTAGSNLTVNNSAFNENMGMMGGAIYVGGEANIANSEFSGHEYATYGGAIYVNTTSPVIISSNEFKENEADKGEAIYIKDGAVSLSGNTMDDESIYLVGGTVNSVLIFLSNSTVNAEFGETVTLTATLTDDQGNAIKGGNVVFTANGETIATVSADNALTTTYTVPSDATGDILISGSYSLDNGGIVATGIVHPAVSYWFIEGGNGYETLAQAVAAAQAGDVIYGTPGTYTVSGLSLNKAITIKANESGAIILDGGASQIFAVSSNVNLINLTLANGKTTGNGGLITVSSGSLTANNTVFKDTIMSTSYTQGAAIYSSGNVSLFNCEFRNLSSRQGAAVWMQSSGTSFVMDNTVIDNVNGTYDGAIIKLNGPAVITKSNLTNIQGATTSGEYGNIQSGSGNLTISECNFINMTGPQGAAIYFTSSSGSVLNITKSVFDNVTCLSKGIIYSTKESYINYNVFTNVNQGVNITSSALGNGNIDYNYWGTNANPSTVMTTYSPTYWVVMTVTPDALGNVDPGATQAFTVDFTHYTNGNANYTLADTIPELTVSASAIKGTLDQSEAETVNGVATFTYTASQNGEETVTFTNANVSIPVSFVVGEGYFGVVYVSKDGSDDNRGSEDAPVATIAKAVEIAKSGSGQIIIKEGTYNENNITIDSTIPISIKGEGDVVIDGTNLSALSVFNIKSGEVSIEKISFANNNAKFGAAINVQGASGSSLLNANILINECSFDSLGSNASGSQGGAIYAKYLSGSLVINNSNFTNTIVKSWGGALTAAYCAYENALDLVISNCNFENNSANNGGAAYLMANTISIVNTSFINNNASYSPGALELYNCTATMDNCSFINNTAKNTAAAIKLEFVTNQPITSLQVTNSIFKDNVGRDEIAPAIFVDRASLNISNSILLNPLDINTSTVTGYGAVEGQGVTIANSNWWGTNENPFNLTAGTGDHVNTTIDNWVIMNVSPTEATGYTGEALEITVDFKYTMSTDGTIETLAGTLPEELTVNANAANGTLDKNTVETTNLVAKFAFTPEFVGENIVNVYTTESNTIPVTIMVTEKYAGPIYVTKDGNDENEGSEASPVATIAKAIELAQGRSGQIIIGEGTYVESNLTISQDLNITAIGDVIWDANGQRAFSMSTGNVSIANVTFINGNATSYGHLIRCDGDSIAFDDCKFISNGGNVSGTNGVIYVNLASAKFNNCYFENNTAGTGTSYGLISAKDSVIFVDGCTFTNNYNKNGCIYVSGSNIGSMAIINNTKFIGNNATSASGGSGGAIYASGSMAYQYSNGTVRPGAQSTVYVVDCEFINNTAFGGKYYSAEGGAIFVNANATLYAANSSFINNTARDYEETDKKGRGGAIAAQTGNVQISNCIFEGNNATNGSAISMKFANKDLTTLNMLNISNSVIMGPGEKLIACDFTNGSLIANNNWWATNDNPSDKVTEGITVNTWVILTADPAEITGARVGEPVEITVNFRHTNSTGGTVAELTGEFPELEVYGYALDGEITESNITLNNVATLYFTPDEVGETTVYAVAGNVMLPIKVIVEDTPQPVDIVYVSLTGNDGNAGTYEAPVATIAKAVELASAEGALGVIIIEEGVYNENGILINSTHPISISGNGTVIIRGNNPNVNGNGAGLVGAVSESTSIMIVNTTEAVEIKNIQFADNIAANGGAILINPDTSRDLKTVNVAVENCTFTNLKGRDGGAIFGTYINGTVSIKDCNFTANTATSWGGAVSMEYSAYDNDCLKFEVSGSNFENNTANNGGALYLMAQDITIKDSTIANNNATYHPGALYLQNCTALINNTVIANNSAKYDKAAIAIHGATISYQTREVNPANVTITNCIIENNTGRDRAAPAIYLENSNMNMSYSSVVNDININNTVTATYGDEKPGLVLINNNWWGTNDPSSTIFGTNITMDKWVIMNVVANATEVSSGEEVKLTVDFNHVNTTAGEIEELTGGVIPRESYTVTLAVDNGTIAPQTLTIANGESGEAVFTAASANALITATSENAVENILVLVGEQQPPYSGIVYVSKDGDDANNGSEEAPVSTIAKAIEIANGEFGSGQIIINEGTYNEYGFNITKDLTITGVGDVVIDGEDLGRLFFMSYGTQVGKFALSNLVLTGAKYSFGAVIYSFAEETELTNVTITGNNYAGDLITTYGNLSIKDSEISNNDAGDVIQASGNSNIVLNNTLFNDNVVTSSTADYGIVYVADGKGNLIVDDCVFYNNTARQGVLIGNSYTNITVINSLFLDNNNTVAYGGAIRALSKLDVTDTVFMNNAAGREGGAIYIGSNGNATITKSTFINNTCANYDSYYNGDAISSHGKLTINYCILLPAEGSSKVLIFNGNEDVTPNAQYNWWGTNDNPSSLVAGDSYYDSYEGDVDCPAPDVSNWIIMNVVADTENAEAGAILPITVDFKHYLDANGEVQELADSLGQELVVNFISETGLFDSNEVITSEQVAVANYTVANGVNSIAVKSSDAIVNIGFVATGLVETELSVENVTISVGSGSLVATLTANGQPVAGKTIKVTVGTIDTTATTDADGKATVDLSTLAIGNYTASIVFEEDSEYKGASAEASVTVTKVKKTAQDLQALIDNAPEGSVVDLGEFDYENVSNVNITKDITLMGNGTTITGAGDGSPIFNVVPKSENGPNEVNITNVEFIVKNADIIVKAVAENDTNPTSIDVASINFAENNITTADDEVVPESVTVLELESERGILSPTGDIVIKDNIIDAGIRPFKFDVTSVVSGSDANITSQNLTTEKKASVIEYADMETVAVDTVTDGRVGEYFIVTLKDTEGNILVGKDIQIGFNGNIYNRTTDENGTARVQINLGTVNWYTFAVSFLGDDEYNASFVVAKINVVAQKGTLSVPAKSYAASAKTKTLTATFKSASGKVVKGKKITFTVNGKTYTATTNANGLATVKVSLNKKGTYSFTAKFAGDRTYAAITKTAKLTIK